MSHSVLYVLALLVICRAEFNANEYVKGKKEDINSWDLFFPRHSLERELQTTLLAKTTAQDVAYSLGTSLTTMVSNLRRELNIAQMMMEDTPAKGCVNGIAGYMDNAVKEAVSDYNACSDDIQSSLTRMNNALNMKITNYHDVYKKTMIGIDNCAKTYPNSGSKNRLTMCVTSWENHYFRHANRSMFNTSNSPAMNQFKKLVGECAETAARDVISEGERFISLLARCYKMSDNLDYESYKSQLELGYSKWLPVISLANQTLEAQNSFSTIETVMNSEILRYYEFHRPASAKYEIESRNETYYANFISQKISDYWTTVASTSNDHPAQAQCGYIAQQSLSSITTTGSQEAMQCDQSIVSQTRRIQEDVKDEMVKLIIYWLSYGNLSLLSCFSKGYIYANNTIFGCFYLAISEFKINISEGYETIVKNMEILRENEKLLSNNIIIPCGKPILSRVRLESDRTLFNYHRCLYQESGTNYEVTTPSSSTATTGYGITTEANVN